MTGITLTPNLKLSKLPANFHVWAQTMNDNLTMVDAAISGFIVFNNLRGAWANSTTYALADTVVDLSTAVIWQANVAHTSSTIPTTFTEERTTHPTYWSPYSAAARARGAWTPNTVYALNDFVVSGNQYAVCIAANTSGATFAADLALGYWSILIDLSSVGSSVLPVPGGAADANKFVVTPASGLGYTITSVPNVLTLLGATSIGIDLLQTVSQAAARATINAQIAGSYQTLDATLTALSGAPTVAFGISLLNTLDAAALRTAAGLTFGAAINTWLNTPSSANLASAVTDETGSGALVFGTGPTLSSPTLVTPALGTPSALVLTNATGLPPTGLTGDLANQVNAASWTPTDQSGAALAFTSVSGRYTRIGNMVFASFSLTWPATGSGATTSISLPVAVPNQTYANSASLLHNSGAATIIYGKTAQNSSNFTLFSGTAGNFTNNQLSGLTISGTIVYPAT